MEGNLIFNFDTLIDDWDFEDDDDEDIEHNEVEALLDPINLKVKCFNQYLQFEHRPKNRVFLQYLFDNSICLGMTELVKSWVHMGLNMNYNPFTPHPSHGNIPLLLAIKHKHIEIVKALIEQGVDLDPSMNNNNYFLHEACLSGSQEIIELLLDRYVDVNAINSKQKTPIEILISERNLPLVCYLISRNADIQYANSLIKEDGTSLLSIAMESFDYPMLDYLIDIHKLDINQKNKFEDTPILHCLHTWNNHLQILISYPMNSTHNIPNNPTFSEKILTLFQYLLKRNYRIHLRGQKGFTIYDIAFHFKQILWLNYFCQQRIFHLKTSYVLPDNSNNFLFAIIDRNDNGFFNYLLQCDIEINYHDHEGITPLMKACQLNRISMVKGLLKFHAKVNSIDKKGWTALMYACREGHREIIDYLLVYDAKQTIINQNHQTALDILYQYRYYDIIHRYFPQTITKK